VHETELVSGSSTEQIFIISEYALGSRAVKRQNYCFRHKCGIAVILLYDCTLLTFCPLWLESGN